MAELYPAVADDKDQVEENTVNENKKDASKAPLKPTLFSDERGNLKFVNVVVRHPMMIFFFMIILCIASTQILGALIRRGGNPITEDSNEYDINDIRSIAYDTLRLAGEEVKGLEEIRRRLNEGEEELPQSKLGDITYWIYKAKTEKGMFDPDSITSMREAEGTILDHPNYAEYCHLKYKNETSSECNKPLSAMNIYYASEWKADLVEEIMADLDPENIKLYNTLSSCYVAEIQTFCDQLPSNVTNNIATIQWVVNTTMNIGTVMSTWDGKGELNSDVEQVTRFMAYLKELNSMAPYVNFFFDDNFGMDNLVSMHSRSIVYWGELLNGTNNETESGNKLKRFILDNLLDRWDEITDKKYDAEVQSYYFMGALIWDIILKILVLDGVKALASFVFVFFYLRFMLGSWFLTAVGMFEIFMSLPLAWITFSYIFQIKYFSALNTLCIFIVMAIGADDIFVFMDAYKQSANRSPDILVDLETRMSWVYRRSGSAMLLTSVTTCSAFMCTLISPIAGTRSFGVFAAFVILFDYILVMTLFCTAVVIYHDRFEAKSCCCDMTFWRKSERSPTQIAMEKRENGEPKEFDKISKFFEEKIGPFILNQKNRLVIFVILIAWIIVTCIFTARLKPTTSAEQFLDDNHPLQIGSIILNEEFPKTQEDLTSKVHFVWGLENVERDGVNQLLDPEFVGVANYGENFSFDTTCQAAILDACDVLRTDPDLEEFILKRDGIRGIDCFVEQVGTFNAIEDAKCEDVNKGLWRNEAWQVPSDELSVTMSNFFEQDVCGEEDEKVKDYYMDTVGWDGTELKFAGISVYSSLLDPRGVLAEDIVRVHYDKFIKVAEKFDSTVGQACGTTTIMTDLDQKFVFMNNQRIYRTSAVTGSMVGVAVAFVVVFISTLKVHLALFATLSILAVLLGVIGSISLIGWTLGTIEAILISILAGFSVDYVIHLAHAYNHAEGDVEERVLAAFGDMGISVFSGMLTSVVASIPLFFCTLTFFAKFGTFLCLTIVLSWIFANFGFMSLLAQFKVSMDKKWL